MQILEDMLEGGWLVYWAPLQDDEGNPITDPQGDQLYDDPVDLPCRWEDSVELFVTKTGTQITSKSKIYVGVDLKEDGIVHKGKKADVLDLDDPLQNKYSHVIIRFDKLPTMHQEDEEFLRTAYV